MLIPFEAAVAPWTPGEGVAAGAEAAGAFDTLADAGGLGAGVPVAEAPHLPQNCTPSLRLDPQFLQNALMFISITLRGLRRLAVVRLVCG